LTIIHIKGKMDIFIIYFVLFTITKQDTKTISLSCTPLTNTILSSFLFLFLLFYLHCLYYLRLWLFIVLVSQYRLSLFQAQHNMILDFLKIVDLTISFFYFYIHRICCYPIFDPCFDKFSEKFKNSEKHWKSKKIRF
jgi:hypothetical protein